MLLLVCVAVTSRYVRFAWGRSRLPSGSARWTSQHKLSNACAVLAADCLPSLHPMLVGTSALLYRPRRVFSIHRGKDDRKLPVSHTCFFHVELPDYSTEERMRWGLTIG